MPQVRVGDLERALTFLATLCDRPFQVHLVQFNFQLLTHTNSGFSPASYKRSRSGGASCHPRKPES